MNEKSMTAATMTVEDAESLAERAHAGQVDKAGRPYIEHPRAVATWLTEQGWCTDVVVAGWLHDVVEDTELGPDDLADAGASDLTLLIVDAVTRRPGETYMEMIRDRVCPVPGAVAVKLADNRHNSSEDRLACLPVEQAAFLRSRYAKARAVLVDALAWHVTGRGGPSDATA